MFIKFISLYFAFTFTASVTVIITLIAFSILVQSQDLLSLSPLSNPISLPFSSKNFPSSNGKGKIKPTRPISWTNCGEPDDLFQLEFLELIPDPPRRSSPLTVKLGGSLKERLEGGVVGYEVKFGGFKLATGKLDGCDALKKERNLPQCPVEAGPIDVSHTIEMPWQIPVGKYNVHVFGERSSDHKQIFCLNLDLFIDR